MRVKSPFSEKSSARSILTRAKGLGILIFDKIRKMECGCDFDIFETEMAGFNVIMSKLNKPSKNEFKNFFTDLENEV